MEPLLAYITIVATVLVLTRFRLEPILVAAIGIAQVAAGFVVLDTRQGSSISLTILAFVASVFAGHAALDSRVHRACSGTLVDPPVDHTPSGRSVLILRRLVALVVLGTAVHFMAAGVPILSGEVETARFSFSGSGLFGLPGRLYLFGLPIMAMVVGVSRSRPGGVVFHRLTIVVWAAYGFSRLAGGFKGGLYEVAIVGLLTYAASRPGRPLLTPRLTIRVLLLGSLAIAVATSLAVQYTSVEVDSAAEAFPYLVDRYTVGSAQAGYYLLTEEVDAPSAGGYLLEDFRYFTSKYLGFTLGSEPPAPLDRRVAASIFRQRLDDSTYLAPVTLGLGSSLFVEFSYPVVLAMGFLVGMLYRWAVNAVRRRPNLELITPIAVLLALGTWLSNGGLAYLAINYGAIILVFAVLIRLHGNLARVTGGPMATGTRQPVPVGR